MDRAIMNLRLGQVHEETLNKEACVAFFLQRSYFAQGIIRLRWTIDFSRFHKIFLLLLYLHTMHSVHTLLRFLIKCSCFRRWYWEEYSLIYYIPLKKGHRYAEQRTWLKRGTDWKTDSQTDSQTDWLIQVFNMDFQL